MSSPLLIGSEPSLLRHWLGLGLFSLGIAGAYALLIAMLRTPGIEVLLTTHHLFRTFIVAHVNLSVLVWLLSMTGVYLTSLYQSSFGRFIGKIAAWTASIGALLIAVTPFLGHSSEELAVMSNYIPVLKHPLFFIGLGLVASSQILLYGYSILLWFTQTSPKLDHLDAYIRVSIFGLLPTYLTVIACFFLSYHTLLPSLEKGSEGWYEALFWGGGHILQYAYTQLMVIAWLILGKKSYLPTQVSFLKPLLLLNIILVIPVPLSYFIYPAGSAEHQLLFTTHMRDLSGIPALYVFLWLLWIKGRKLFTEAWHSVEQTALLGSFLLFGLGGLLGYAIYGVNVTIPAHYHGSTIGVSLALIGIAYSLVPAFTKTQLPVKAAKLQLSLYSLGQIIHILGLAWSGGYGVLRKTAGAAYPLNAKISMGMMGLGALIATLGGLMFLAIMTYCFLRRSR